MLIKDAKKIIISLSKPDKMPGYAYGHTSAGSARQAASSGEGSWLSLLWLLCMKGNYTRFPEIKRAI